MKVKRPKLLSWTKLDLSWTKRRATKAREARGSACTQHDL
jgi:hypothetical protein